MTAQGLRVPASLGSVSSRTSHDSAPGPAHVHSGPRAHVLFTGPGLTGSEASVIKSSPHSEAPRSAALACPRLLAQQATLGARPAEGFPMQTAVG